MFQIDSTHRKSIYEQVVDNLKELIIRGLLAEKSKLPSVRELSRTLRINPNTVQKAYKELERQGYIYTSSGLGTFVASIDTAVLDMEKYHTILEQLEFNLDELYYLGLEDDDVLAIIKKIIDERRRTH